MGPTHILFTAVAGKPRFTIAVDGSDLEAGDYSGRWHFSAQDAKSKLYLTFDKDQGSVKEFEWVDSFDWNESQEPASRIKAKDNDGFFIWCVSEEDSHSFSELGEPRIRADELHPKISVTGTEERVEEEFSDISKKDNDLVHLNSMPPAVSLLNKPEFQTELVQQLSLRQENMKLSGIEWQKNFERDFIKTVESPN